MRWLALLIGLPLSVGLTIVSMIANWRFGIRLGAEAVGGVTTTASRTDIRVAAPSGLRRTYGQLSISQ